jgi:hypothetical protein
MEVICLESEAFYRLVKEVVDRIRADQDIQQVKWISGEEAMQLLNISSKNTLQKYRDEGKIRFSKQGRKIILYDRDSVMKFLDDNARETF